jgi:hypothetical protein
MEGGWSSCPHPHTPLPEYRVRELAPVPYRKILVIAKRQKT